MTEVRRILYTLVAAACASVVSGCSGQAAAPVQQTAKPAHRFIYVTTESVPGECYTDLGTVRIAEPFAQASVDQDQSEAANRLRAEALREYPDDVDAVINVQSEQNDAGTDVNLTGEAIRMEDHPTVQCALRGSKGVLDAAAILGAGGIGGATVGGLAGGSAAATSLGIAGASAMGSYAAMQHAARQQQQQQELSDSLAEQRRKITQLLRQRAQLRKCQEEEISLQACLASPASSGSSERAESDEGEQSETNASPFELQRHLQEQQEYIKKLTNEIAQIKWQMEAH
jgi:hypothetical protein